ncbi:MAG TPA: hypothetical protein VE982_06430 [Gaiellaceae bacterium]|nr:hypothetical protein [Gaiellaceae bacterium]
MREDDVFFDRERADVLRFGDADLAFDLAFVFDFDFDAARDFEAAFDLDFVADFDFDFDFERDDADFAFDFAFVLDFALELFDRPPVFFVLDFFVLDFFARDDLFALDFFRELADLRRAEVERRRGSAADCSSSPDDSSSEPISFFATPTAAGIATPSAVPATTFCAVDRPSSSSFDMVTSRAPTSRGALRHFASLNASMNFGTIRSRRISGPCVATYLPAASAASSAIGSSTSAAASQLVAAADARMPFDFFAFSFSELPLPFSLERSWSCENALRTAYVAAVVAAAAAAAFSAVLPEPLGSFS